MSIFGRITSVAGCGFAIAAALLLSSFVAQAANPGPAVATVTFAEPSSGYVRGQTIPLNTLVKTGNGKVTLDLGDAGLIVVKANTEVKVTKLESIGNPEKDFNAELELTKGGLSGNVKKISAKSKYEVKTSNGIAGIRGTEFSISSDGATTVYNGTVVIIFVINGIPSPPVTVKAGQTVLPPTAPGGVATPVSTPAGFTSDVPHVTTKDTATPPIVTVTVASSQTGRKEVTDVEVDHREP